MSYDNNIEMTILIKGRPITEYSHRGQIFVEGRAASEYTIRVKNKTSGRVEAIVSVDGLSVTDGKTAGPTSGGHMLNAYEEIEIPCWIVNSGTGAKFSFSGKQHSYSTEVSGGDSNNTGVIGVMAFSEKRPVYQNTVLPQYQHPSYNPYPFVIVTGVGYAGTGLGINSVMSNNAVGASNMRYGATASSASASSKSTTKMSAIRGSGGSGFDDYAEASSVNHIETQSLGTAFGDAMDYNTVKVDFNRGDHISTLVIYYDDARSLRARGVIITRPSKQKFQTKPEAFPGMDTGCQPPNGWRDNR